VKKKYTVLEKMPQVLYLRPSNGFAMPYILMLLTAFFWAGAFIAAKAGVDKMPVMTLAAWRFLITGALLSAIWRWQYPGQPLFPRAKRWQLLWLGLGGMAGYHFFFLYGVSYTQAANASFIVAINPVVVTLLAAVVLKDKLNRAMLAGIFLALCGVVFVLARGDLGALTGLQFNRGDLLMLGAPTLWAWYSVYSLKWLPGYHPLQITAATTLLAGIALLPFLLLNPGDISAYGWQGWSAILYLALFASVFGFAAWQWALSKVGAGSTAIFINLVPVFTLVLSYLFYAEIPNLMTITAAMVVIAGVLLTVFAKSR
jgi:drug/metabolite transporter (DMT)-like permease